MKIQITQDDIDKGKPCNAYDCPAALAIQRALGTKNISVRVDYITIWPDYIEIWPMRRITTPDEVNNFIDAIDAGKGAKPMEFELDVQ